MASFPKAQLKRFNDVEPHGPTPGAHEPGLTPYSDREVREDVKLPVSETFFVCPHFRCNRLDRCISRNSIFTP